MRYEQLKIEDETSQQKQKCCNVNVWLSSIIIILNIIIVIYSSVLVTIFKDNYIQFFNIWIDPVSQYLFISISSISILYYIIVIPFISKRKYSQVNRIIKNMLIISYIFQGIYLVFYMLTKIKYPLETNPIFEPYNNQTKVMFYSSTKQNIQVNDEQNSYQIKLNSGHVNYIINSQKFQLIYKNQEYNIDFTNLYNFSVYSDFHTQLQVNDHIPNNVQLLIHAGDIANGWKMDTYNSFKGIKRPLLQALGNHDQFTQYFEHHFRNMYTQKVGNCLFIFLVTTYSKGDFVPEQGQKSIQFLNNLQYDPQIKHTFIINHQPLYKEYNNDQTYQQLLQTINQMADKFKIRGIFSGHRHRYIALHQQNPDIYNYVVSSLGLPNTEDYVNSPDFIMTSDQNNIVQVQIFDQKIVYTTINTNNNQILLQQEQYFK